MTREKCHRGLRQDCRCFLQINLEEITTTLCTTNGLGASEEMEEAEVDKDWEYTYKNSIRVLEVCRTLQED